MAKYAFLVGVEMFSDQKIRHVRFATADAEDLAEVFKELGFDVTLLVDGKATRAALKSKLQKAIDRLQPEDTFCLFIASHGYSEGGKNFVYCHDTQASDLKKTSLALQWIYERLGGSGCEHCMMFLDACGTGIEIDDGMRAHVGEISDDELLQLADKAVYCVGFAACRSHQKSYSSIRLGHGIWTHCLIEALTGNAKDALSHKQYVTASKLQKYLSQEVPRELRKDWPEKVQTPWQFGGQSGDFIIADLGNILAVRRKPLMLDMTYLKRVLFRADETGSIVKLSGFKKGLHYVPKHVNDHAAGFVASIAMSELAENLEGTFTTLRDTFGYKRKDIELRGPIDGGGSIDTPHFTYSVNITQNPEDAAQYLLKREITNIKDPDVVFFEEFNDSFGGMFDILEFQFSQDIEVEDVIDGLEKAGVKVHYDSGATFGRFVLPPFPVEIEFDAGSLRLIHRTALFPRELVSAFKKFREIAAHQELKMLPVM